MTPLICLVQRLHLGDDKHTLIREKEVFEVDEETAQTYILGGIAKPVPVPAPVPEPVTEVQSEPEPEPEPVQTQTEEAKRVIVREKRKR